MHLGYRLRMTELECVRETHGNDSDEPYVIVVAANIRGPNVSADLDFDPSDPDGLNDAVDQLIGEVLGATPQCRTTLYGPFDDVDAGEKRKLMSQAKVAAMPATFRARFAHLDDEPCWGTSGRPEAIEDPNDVLILVAVVENDSGEPNGIRGLLQAASQAAVLNQFPAYLDGRLNRVEYVRSVRREVEDVLRSAVMGWPDQDDLVAVEELHLKRSDLGLAERPGGWEHLSVTTTGHGGRFIVRFHMDAVQIDEATGHQPLKAASAIGPQPAIVGRRTGHLDVIGRGDDRRLYISSWQGKRWSPWSPIGVGTFSSGVASTALRGREDMVVAGRGDDRRIWHCLHRDSGWGDWKPVGDGTFLSAPAVVERVDGSLHFFGLGLDRCLYEARVIGNRKPGWARLGPMRMASAPVAVHWRGDRVDLFALGEHRGVVHIWNDGSGWKGWKRIGDGTFRSAPGAASWGDQRLDVFAVGDDRRMYHSVWAGGAWEPWAHDTDEQNGTFRSAPSVHSAGPNRLDLVAVGDDRRIYHNQWNGSRWSGWLQDTPNGTFR